MKLCLALLGLLVAAFNAWWIASPASAPASLVPLISVVAGVAIAVAAFTVRTQRAPDVPAPHPPAAPAAPVVPAIPPATPAAAALTPPAPALPAASSSPARAEAELVALLALLQEKGRLIDFVREDIAAATDEQIGAAARVVHSGCRQVISEGFDIGPVRTEPEGAKVVLLAGYDAAAHRLIGTVPAVPPYHGTLLHPGWRVRAVRLPRVTTPAGTWPILAPAEVEITSQAS